MRRTAIKKKPPKEMPAEEVAMYQEYGIENWFCEWAFYLGITVDRNQLHCNWEGQVIDASARNHIYSLGRRPNLKSNLISLTNEAHDWFHANLPKGRLLCICAKLKKQKKLGTFDEFTLDEINAAAGRNVEGVIQGWDFQDSLFWKMQEETLGLLKDLVLTQLKQNFHKKT